MSIPVSIQLSVISVLAYRKKIGTLKEYLDSFNHPKEDREEIERAVDNYIRSHESKIVE